MSDQTVLPAVELVRLLRLGAISAVELVEEHIREIERLDPSLRAFAHFDPERAISSARRADRNRESAGPLFGLPVTVKASIATAGYRCENGSVLQRGHIPQQDAVAVTRLRAAGATVLGTTNCPEFLMAYETDNRLYGRTANPWDLGRTAGGSSGGEAAAIAAGLSAGGIGSDSGGSVREPAHFTGICSLKPTPGRIPAAGHLLPSIGPFALLGCLGPMARTIADVTLYFHLLAGQHPSDPVSVPLQPFETSEQLQRERPIGLLEDDGLIPVTAETREALRAAASSLEARGFRIEPFRSTQLEPLRQLWWTFFMRCGLMLLGPLIREREAECSIAFQYFLHTARRQPPLTGEEILTAWSQCDLVRGRFLEEFLPYSALLAPVCSVPAFRHGERQWNVEGRSLEYFEAMRFTQWFNVLGAPAAVVPVGRSPEGLPIGVQIIGRPYEDEHTLSIAALLDEDFGYRPSPIALSTRLQAAMT